MGLEKRTPLSGEFLDTVLVDLVQIETGVTISTAVDVSLSVVGASDVETLLVNLEDVVLSQGLTEGTKRALLKRIDGIRGALAREDRNAPAGVMRAIESLIRLVEGRTGRTISAGQALALLEAVETLVQILEDRCPPGSP